jgi:hypothetical protein
MHVSYPDEHTHLASLSVLHMLGTPACASQAQIADAVRNRADQHAVCKTLYACVLTCVEALRSQRCTQIRHKVRISHRLL